MKHGVLCPCYLPCTLLGSQTLPYPVGPDWIECDYKRHKEERENRVVTHLVVTWQVVRRELDAPVNPMSLSLFFYFIFYFFTCGKKGVPCMYGTCFTNGSSLFLTSLVPHKSSPSRPSLTHFLSLDLSVWIRHGDVRLLPICRLRDRSVVSVLLANE